MNALETGASTQESGVRSQEPGAGTQESELRSRDSGTRRQAPGARSQESGVRSGRAPARTFEDLVVWQKAHAWVLAAYRFSDGFPQKEIYALTSQMRRAAISIPANIAEGFKKTGVADKRRYMNTAQGSLEECRYYLVLSRDLGYGDVAHLLPQLEEVSRLLNAYSRAITTPGS